MTDMMPVCFDWDGEAMIPQERFKRRAEQQFVIGDTYRLVVEEERLANSHRHYFASLAEAWRNLPEDLADRFESPEALRAWALIKTGYHDETSVVCDTEADAKRIASFMGMLRDYAVIVVKGNVVKRYTAKSQSVRAMDKAAFEASKRDVLDLVASMIGVDPRQLAAEASRTAPPDDPEDPGPTPDRPSISQRASAMARGELDPAQAPIQPVTAPSTPAASPSPANGIGAPSDAGSYMAYAAGWIAEAADRQGAIARWHGEHEMRAAFAVPMAATNRLAGMLHAKFPGK